MNSRPLTTLIHRSPRLRWPQSRDRPSPNQFPSSQATTLCYAGQFQKYEGLTCNFAEAVDSAGGQITDENGKPNVNTPEALKGLSFLTDSFKDGTIPKAAITWKEEESRIPFQNGELIFLRNWAYVYNRTPSEVSVYFMSRLRPGADTLRSLAAPAMVPVTITARMTSIWRSVSIPVATHRDGDEIAHCRRSSPEDKSGSAN